MDLPQLEQALKDSPARHHGAIAKATLRPQFKLHWFEQLPSTNTQTWHLIDAGAAAGTAVIAACQSAGRGQWGRQWQSGIGGLYLSLALAPELDAHQGTMLTLASGLGIAQSLNDLEIPVRLKWPNDLMLEDRKLGGILTESRLIAGHMAWAVVGVGLNWANAVPASGIALKSFLMATDSLRIDSLERLAAITLNGIVQGCHQYQTLPTSRFIQAYDRLLINRGQQITMANGHSGEVIGVSDSGALKIRCSTDLAGSLYEIQCQPGEIALGYNT